MDASEVLERDSDAFLIRRSSLVFMLLCFTLGNSACLHQSGFSFLFHFSGFHIRHGETSNAHLKTGLVSAANIDFSKVFALFIRSLNYVC
jgi:hypothetical protein